MFGINSNIWKGEYSVSLQSCHYFSTILCPSYMESSAELTTALAVQGAYLTISWIEKPIRLANITLSLSQHNHSFLLVSWPQKKPQLQASRSSGLTLWFGSLETVENVDNHSRKRNEKRLDWKTLQLNIWAELLVGTSWDKVHEQRHKRGETPHSRPLRVGLISRAGSFCLTYTRTQTHTHTSRRVWPQTWQAALKFLEQLSL